MLNPQSSHRYNILLKYQNLVSKPHQILKMKLEWILHNLITNFACTCTLILLLNLCKYLLIQRIWYFKSATWVVLRRYCLFYLVYLKLSVYRQKKQILFWNIAYFFPQEACFKVLKYAGGIVSRKYLFQETFFPGFEIVSNEWKQ